MAFVSVTRLRLRSFRFLLPFLVSTTQSRRQVRRAPGFVEGRMSIEFPRAFWTVTVWESRDAMREFRNTAAHLRAMPRLLAWCDEGSYANWEQPVPEAPPLDVAHQRLRTEGHVSKVNHPSPTHAAGKTTSDAVARPAPAFRSAR